MATRSESYFEFGPFRLSATEGLLLRDGAVVALTPKAFEILLILVRNCGHLVERGQLINTVWPDTFVEEANLTQNIFNLRKALGENYRSQKYIQTVARRGYRFVAEVKEVFAATDVTTSREDETVPGAGDAEAEERSDRFITLAVLPFVNMSNEPAMEYLSDGITESLINNLSYLSQLRVSASSSVFRFKGRKADPLLVGRELSVDAVVLGRVLSFGERLIIRTELVDAANGWQLWGEQYDRKSADLVEVQEEIAREVAAKLRVRLTGTERRLLAKRHTRNGSAYHYYLKGRFFWNKYTKDGTEKSVSFFQQAVDLDPNFALAYAGLADAYLRMSNLYLPPGEALPKAKEAALKALEIDEFLAEAYASLAQVKMYYDHDWAGAESACRRAIELNFGASLAHKRYGEYLMYRGHFDQALEEHERALQIDPLSLQTNLTLGTNLYLMKEYERAIVQLQKTLELDKNYCPAHLALGCAYLFGGQHPEAIREFRRAWQLDKKAFMLLGFLGFAYAVSGNRSGATEVLEKLKAAAKNTYVSPYAMAIIHLGLGDRESALEWLWKTFEERNDFLVWLNVAPELKELRSDPRLTDLLRKVGFNP